jgi:hypothetical protein
MLIARIVETLGIGNAKTVQSIHFSAFFLKKRSVQNARGGKDAGVESKVAVIQG